MQSIVRRFTLGTLALSGIVMCPPAQQARADTPQADAPAPDEELQFVTVVAQKQNISLQKAPESITALSAESLEQSNVITPLDLNGQVPGLVITTSDFNRSVSIRGIGFNTPQQDSAQPSVSYHEDGIYIVYPVALNSGFLDVDHVEVLRGPQGTVFGQNSIGGTINVISKQPTLGGGITGDVNASTGSRDLVHTSAAVNLPLSSTFAVRIAYDQNYQRGYVTATQVPGTDGNYDLNNRNDVHGRIQALWQPEENLSVLLRAEYAQAREHESEAKSIYDPQTDPWRESSDWPGRTRYNQQLAAATISYNMPAATLKVLSSYQEVNQHGSANEDGLNVGLTAAQGAPHDLEYFLHNSKNITEEVNLNSKPGGNLDWIVGAFYLGSILTEGYDQYFAFPGDATPDLLNVSTPTPAIIDAINSGLLYYQDRGLQKRESWSGYGQATYHVSNSLRLSAGLRYTHDHNSGLFSNFYGPLISIQQTATKATYRLAADYDLTEVNLLYASVSTGFKPGGGNIAASPAIVPYIYQPETITAYELGSKNSFLHKTLNVNVSAYFYQDKNMQFEAEDLINYQGGVDNIPHTDVYGLEGEVVARLPYDLRLDGNLSLEKGRITTHFHALDNDAGNAANQLFISQYGYAAFQNAVYTGSPALNALRQAAYKDVYGNAPPSLPAVVASLNLSHTLTLGDGSTLLSRIDAQYRSDYADTIFGKTPIYTAPSYVLTNLYFDYTFKADSWDVSLAVNNLFDRAAVLSRFTNQFGGETTQLYYPPREFIAGVHWRF